jgi:hypothetical protein
MVDNFAENVCEKGILIRIPPHYFKDLVQLYQGFRFEFSEKIRRTQTP